jgi:hypothetical protein
MQQEISVWLPLFWDLSIIWAWIGCTRYEIRHGPAMGPRGRAGHGVGLVGAGVHTVDFTCGRGGAVGGGIACALAGTGQVARCGGPVKEKPNLNDQVGFDELESFRIGSGGA